MPFFLLFGLYFIFFYKFVYHAGTSTFYKQLFKKPPHRKKVRLSGFRLEKSLLTRLKLFEIEFDYKFDADSSKSKTATNIQPVLIISHAQPNIRTQKFKKPIHHDLKSDLI